MTTSIHTDSSAPVFDSPIYFHIGYPKTATTTLQQRVSAALHGVTYLGKLSDGSNPDFVNWEMAGAVHEFLLVPEMEYSGGPLAQAVRQYVAGSHHHRGTLLLSHEGIANPFHGNIAIKANRVAREFPNARVIIVVRSQIDLLRSLWEMRPATPLGPGTGRKALSFNAWIAHALRYESRSLLPSLRYAEVARYYARLFGSGRVLLLLFEWLQSDPPLFFDKLAGFIGADPDKMMRLMANRRENSATEHRIRHSAVARMKRGLLPNLSFRQALPDWLYGAVVSLLGRKRRRVALKPELITRLSEYYGESNRSLSELLGTDVSALGYLTQPSD